MSNPDESLPTITWRSEQAKEACDAALEALQEEAGD
jgi:hypothetical protein